MKALILGNGTLGEELKKITGWDCLNRDEFKQFDFNDLESYKSALKGYDTIVNCVADTKVYLGDKDVMFKTNFRSVAELARYCSVTGKKLVHFSSDYVYGFSSKPAKETDVPVHAKNWYSLSKLCADEYIEAFCDPDKYLIIRTSFKKNPYPRDGASACQVVNADYVNVLAPKFKKLIELGVSGVINVGTRAKTEYELARQTKDYVMALSLHSMNATKPVNVEMDLSRMKSILGEDSVIPYKVQE